MERHEAQTIVDRHVVKVEQYQAIKHDVASELLGDGFERLLADPIRNLGPTSDTVYPWNVVDHLVGVGGK